jgi:hypothetical protein
LKKLFSTCGEFFTCEDKIKRIAGDALRVGEILLRLMDSHILNLLYL